MRLSGLGAVSVGVVIAVTAAGCASTVAGEGRLAAGEPIETTAPTDTGEDDLDCAEQSVSPAGAPYCYTEPAGLDEVDLGAPTAGEEGSFRTSYGFGPTDHIDVQAYAVGIDTDDLSDEEIIAELDTVVLDLESGGFDFEAEPTSLEVDGARGFAYQGTATEGPQAIIAHFVFRGSNEVQINCASTEQTVDTIDAACSGVLDSLQIVG